MTRVALCMIAKNEEHVIARCIDSACGLVERVFVVDTGSDDRTVDVVKQAAGDKARCWERPWVDFGANRSEAFQLAREALIEDGEKLSDWYLWVIDADDRAVVNDGFRWPDGMTADSYRLTIRCGSDYERPQLFRADRPWEYRFPVHELATLEGGVIGPVIDGLLVVASHDGARSRNPDKYRNDADLIRRWIYVNGEEPRMVFYLANSLLACHDAAGAAYWYRRRVQMGGGYEQEAVVAGRRLAQCLMLTAPDATEAVELSGLRAWWRDPARAEPIADLEAYWRERGDACRSELYRRVRSTIAMPTAGLFIEPAAYGVGMEQARIGVITAPREGWHPLSTTLNSILASDARARRSKTKVFIDSLHPVQLPAMIEQEANTEQGLERIAEGGIYGTLNYARALSWAGDGSGVCVVLEDDVLCAADWLRKGEELLSAAEQKFGCPVLLNLHHMHDSTDVFEGPVVEAGGHVGFVPSTRTWVNGSQGVMCRPKIAKQMASLLTSAMGADTVEDRKAWAMDVGIYRLCIEVGIAKMVFADPCLLWHLHSAKSTWASKDARWLDDDDAHKVHRETKRWRPW